MSSAHSDITITIQELKDKLKDIGSRLELLRGYL